MKVEFTAQMEEDLDRISEGEQDWRTSLHKYNGLLDEDVKKVEKVEGVRKKGIPVEETCPKCGKSLVIKEGRYGRFKACSGYPDCDYKVSMKRREDEPLEEKCPECGSQLVLRYGKYGSFIACSNYPKCTYTKRDNVVDTGISCPRDCGGTMVRRKTRRGKIFFGCSNYPKCDYATWDEPVKESCPQCGREFVLRKNKIRGDPHLYCSNEECGYREQTTRKKVWEKEPGESDNNSGQPQ
jgi:DNA topoisomerase-1